MILGIGGERILQVLGIKVMRYHMNEGHSALLTLELLKRFPVREKHGKSGDLPFDVQRVCNLCCFTTHTPIDAGHDRFSYNLASRILGDYFDINELKVLAGEDALNMTRLALNASEYVNGVAKKHAEISRQLFPGYHIDAITNGVHPHMWVSRPFHLLFDKILPGWCHEPDLLRNIDALADDEEVWLAHQESKKTLLEFIEKESKITLRLDLPVIGFARRMTGYKRPGLLFSSLERLRAIHKQKPFQLVFAGKAHPRDEGGKQTIKYILDIVKSRDWDIPIVFLNNYDMDVAKKMVAGVDLWLNTPLRPLEASGTSGMKAAFNGVPQLSVLDGWWLEGCVEGVTGWAIGSENVSANGDDAMSLYDKLEHEVLPTYYDNRARWINIMKNTIAKNASFFNTHRMIRRYVTKLPIKSRHSV